jgi:hypothetical protein
VLSDTQIERYCRQIVLPEVGSRGQERLLRSTVSIFAGDDSALVCASHLSSTGVGRLFIEASDEAGSELARALASPRHRNPDCEVLSAPPDSPEVSIWIGEVPPEASTSATTWTLWGNANGRSLTRIRLARSRPPCLGCLSAAAPPATTVASAPARILLGSLLATDALRALLGLADADRAEILRVDLDRGLVSVEPLSRRSDCLACANL